MAQCSYRRDLLLLPVYISKSNRTIRPLSDIKWKKHVKSWKFLSNLDTYMSCFVQAWGMFISIAGAPEIQHSSTKTSVFWDWNKWYYTMQYVMNRSHVTYISSPNIESIHDGLIEPRWWLVAPTMVVTAAYMSWMPWRVCHPTSTAIWKKSGTASCLNWSNISKVRGCEAH